MPEEVERRDCHEMNLYRNEWKRERDESLREGDFSMLTLKSEGPFAPAKSWESPSLINNNKSFFRGENLKRE